MSHFTVHNGKTMLRLNGLRYDADGTVVLTGPVVEQNCMRFVRELWGKDNQADIYVQIGPSCVCLHPPEPGEKCIWRDKFTNAYVKKMNLSFRPGEILVYELHMKMDEHVPEPKDWQEFTGETPTTRLVPYMRDLPSLEEFGIPTSLIPELPGIPVQLTLSIEA